MGIDALSSRKERVLELMRTNRLAEAGALCEEVARNENNAGAWLLLGVIRGMQSNLQEAERCSREAIRLHPGYVDAYCNLGAALRVQGRLDEAIPALRHALKLQPNHVEAYYNLGLALLAEQRLDEAVEILHETIRLKSDHVEAHLYLGAALAAGGRFEEAVDSFHRVLALSPDHATAHVYLGNVHAALGRMEEATASYREALQRQPHNPDTLLNLGNALSELGRPLEAIDCFQQALRLKPGYLAALQNLAIAYLDSGQPDKAETSSRQALELNPDNAAVLTNLGSALARQKNTCEAITLYHQAITLRPDHAEAHFNLGNALRAQGKFDDALASYRDAIAINSQHADAHCNLALTCLALGRFEEGWEEYQWQWNREDAPTRLFPPSPWNGSDLGGRHVFLHAEQGLGDELFFLRFVPWLRRRGAGSVAYLANPKIASFLKRTALVDRVAAPDEKPLPEDLILSVGDLPRLLGMKRVDEIPLPLTLHTLPERLAEMRTKLSALGPSPYLGVTWRGGTEKKKNVLYKEAPLLSIAQTLRGKPGTVLVLQRHPAESEIATFGAALGRTAHDLSAVNDDLESMLALLALIDDYVGVSNTNMHLRAGVGKTARVLVPTPPEWRWMAEDMESPWFPGFTVYRQGYDGSWDTAFAELAVD